MSEQCFSAFSLDHLFCKSLGKNGVVFVTKTRKHEEQYGNFTWVKQVSTSISLVLITLEKTHERYEIVETNHSIPFCVHHLSDKL